MSTQNWAETFSQNSLSRRVQARLTTGSICTRGLRKVEVAQVCLCLEGWCRVRRASTSYTASLTWGLGQLLQLPSASLQSESRGEGAVVRVAACSAGHPHQLRDNVHLSWISPYYIPLSFLIPCPVTSVPTLDTGVKVVHKVLTQLSQLLFTFL